MLNDEVFDLKIFKHKWSGVNNFKFKNPNHIFNFEFPEITKIIDILRKDNEVKIFSGEKRNKLNRRINIHLKKISLEKLCDNKFQLSHFNLNKYFKKNEFLFNFDKIVLNQWKLLLKNNGFTWDRCYPIIFISGKKSFTNYHIDYSHVLAWQIFGEKNFFSIKNQKKYISIEERILSKNIKVPSFLKKSDIIKHQNTPGDLLWNCFLTPHWIESGNEIALSLNISHGGLRYNHKLCFYENIIKKLNRKYNQQLGIIL